jgi:hypothetical protein
MSPYEIDVSLQFQETKILTREEIIDLEDGIRENDFDEAFDDLKGTVENLARQGQAKIQEKIDKDLGEKFKDDYTMNQIYPEQE